MRFRLALAAAVLWAAGASARSQNLEGPCKALWDAEDARLARIRSFHFADAINGSLKIDRLDDSGGESSEFWQTQDGGRHWARTEGAFEEPNALGPPGLLRNFPTLAVRQVETFGDSKGWVVTQALGLSRTVDGGKSWQWLDPPDHECAGVVISAAFDGALWFACGSEGATIMSGKSIYVSRDGGQTWKAGAKTPLFEGDRKGLLALSGHLSDDFEALSAKRAVMVLARGSLLVTEDAGMTWSDPIGDECVYDLGPLQFVSPERGWLATRQRGLMGTSNGGRTWEPLWVPPPPSKD